MSTPTPDLRQQLAETLRAALVTVHRGPRVDTMGSLDEASADGLADALISGPLASRLAALQAVRDLHVEDEHGNCRECSLDEMYEPWPCPTIRALDAQP